MAHGVSDLTWDHGREPHSSTCCFYVFSLVAQLCVGALGCGPEQAFPWVTYIYTYLLCKAAPGPCRAELGLRERP